MKKIRTAIIGLGRITHGYDDIQTVKKKMKFPTHLSVLQNNSKFSLVAACDNNIIARKEFSRKTSGMVNIYSSFGQMLDIEKPELLVVASPTDTHCKICSEAIKMGVPAILCEKPVSYSLSEGKKLIDLAKKKNTIIVFNYFRSFNNKYNKLGEKIKKKHWGEVQSIDIRYTKGIYNTASHIINLLTKIFGKATRTKKLGLVGQNSVDPTLDFSIFFEKFTCHFHGLDKNFYSLLELDIFFSNGRLKFTNDILEEYFVKKSEKTLSKIRKFNKKSDNFIELGLFDVYDNIYNHIVYGKELFSTSEDALYTLKLVSDVAN